MTALRRPDLLLTHLGNHVQLVKAELSSVGSSLALRAAAALVAVVAVLLALGLSGVAVMLGFLHGAFHWVLVAVPGVAWLLALVGALMARRSTLREKVDDVKDELAADLRMLRLIKEAGNE